MTRRPRKKTLVAYSILKMAVSSRLELVELSLVAMEKLPKKTRSRTDA
jgi:hypothetical protein